MNILIIDSSVAFTGAFKCALSEAELLKSEHRIIFLLPMHSSVVGLVKEKGFDVYQLPLKEISRSFKGLALYPLYLILNLTALKRITKKERIEVVQINDFYNLLGAMLKFINYKGKVLTWVRFLPSAIPSTLRAMWTYIAQKYSDRVIAVSDTVLHQLPRRPNTTRIYDPVSFTESFDDRSLKSKNLIRFLFLANFTRGKGQEYAIEAFASAYRINDKVRLKMIGGNMGREKNQAFRNELTQKVRELRLSEVITFHDFVYEVEHEIKAADVLLNFSEAESFSMTCLEASFYGRPVIATRCGGPEEIIVHQQTGLLVPKKDINAMTKAMLTMAADAELRMKYGLRGQEYVRKKFSKETFKTEITQILNERVH